MRAIWSGSISFGLVNIPVQLYPATQHKDIQFHLIHSKCQTPIHYRKFCPACNQEVEAEDIVKAFEYQKGKYVIVTDEDLAAADVKMTRTIDIIDFVKLEEVDPVFYDKTYYLAPTAGAEKAYSLLAQTLESSKQVAIARLVIKNKQHLAIIRAKQEALVLETMFFADEIRNITEIPGLPVEAKATDKELELALGLVATMTASFIPGKYHDEYREKLTAIIQKKVEGKEVPLPEMAEKGAEVIDLMSALKESIEKIKTKQKRGSGKQASQRFSAKTRVKKQPSKSLGHNQKSVS